MGNFHRGSCTAHADYIVWILLDLLLFSEGALWWKVYIYEIGERGKRIPNLDGRVVFVFDLLVDGGSRVRRGSQLWLKI